MLRTIQKAVLVTFVVAMATPVSAQVYRSTVTSADWPESVMCGDSFSVDVTLTNLSRTPWTEAEFHKLGPVMGEDDPFSPDGHKFKMPDGTSVPFGGKHTFSLELTAPEEAGTYETQWVMMRKGEPYGTPIKRSIQVFCDNAELGRALFPSDVPCGLTFKAEVRMKNNGKSSWTEARFYKLGPVMGVEEPFRSDGHKFKMPDGTEVPPGDKYVFEIELTAPEQFGIYETKWVMMQGGKPFGEEISRTIDVQCKR